MFEISKKLKFSASHFLTDYHGKCENLHGHNFWLEVTLRGEKKSDGMLLDFVEMKKIIKAEVIDKLDHKHLNDILENPSSENLCEFIWDKLLAFFGEELYAIKLWENENSSVKYFGR